MALILFINLLITLILKRILKEKCHILDKLYIILVPVVTQSVGQFAPKLKVFEIFQFESITWLRVGLCFVIFLISLNIMNREKLGKLLIAVMILSVGSFFIQALIVISYFIWVNLSKEKNRRHRWVMGLLLLTSVLLPGLGVLGKILLLILITGNFIYLDLKLGRNSLFDTVLMVVSISSLCTGLPKEDYLTFGMSFLILPILLVRLRNSLEGTSDKIERCLSIVFVFTTFSFFVDNNDLGYLYLLFLMMFFFLYNLKFIKKENVLWSLALLLLVASPPFGLGYVFVVNIFEKILENYISLLFVFIPVLLLTQIAIFSLFFKTVKQSLEMIRNKKYIYDNYATGLIALNFLASALFIPSLWSDHYSELFSYYTENRDALSRIGIGYSLFWIEALLWLLLAVIYFKLDNNFIDKILLKTRKPASVLKARDTEALTGPLPIKYQTSIVNIIKSLEARGDYLSKDTILAIFVSVMLLFTLSSL